MKQFLKSLFGSTCQIKFPDQIQLTITNEDYQNADSYLDRQNCVLGTVVKRELNPKDYYIGGTFVELCDKRYRIIESINDGCPILNGYREYERGNRVETFQVTLEKI